MRSIAAVMGSCVRWAASEEMLGPHADGIVMPVRRLGITRKSSLAEPWVISARHRLAKTRILAGG